MIESERARRWASTMEGHATVPDIRLAHAGPGVATGTVAPLARAEREAAESVLLVSGATRSAGAGNRARPEEPDPLRTCFERDRDRILHSTAFRRLAGKTQVFVFPDDHQRTRLTHALEVAQVATAVARATRLNVALTEAIALGHDCGHGPGGHASEEALSPYLDGGYDHAVWGADVVLEPLNLCTETLDGIRNHSWSRPAPATPEGAVVRGARANLKLGICGEHGGDPASVHFCHEVGLDYVSCSPFRVPLARLAAAHAALGAGGPGTTA